MYWFFSCFISASRGKVGEREGKTEQANTLLWCWHVQTTFSLCLDVCVGIIKHSQECKKIPTSCNINIIHAADYYITALSKMCLHMCMFLISYPTQPILYPQLPSLKPPTNPTWDHLIGLKWWCQFWFQGRMSWLCVGQINVRNRGRGWQWGEAAVEGSPDAC